MGRFSGAIHALSGILLAVGGLGWIHSHSIRLSHGIPGPEADFAGSIEPLIPGISAGGDRLNAQTGRGKRQQEHHGGKDAHRVSAMGEPGGATPKPLKIDGKSGRQQPVSARPRVGRIKAWPVPASMRGGKLPVFLQLGSFVENRNVISDAISHETILEAPAGQDLAAEVDQLAMTEAAALLHAEKLFLDAMEAAPTQDASSPDYADWWAAARERAENHLRLVLGWDRFNTLRPGELEEETLAALSLLSLHGTHRD